jgi:oleandomycin transport system ATP-binding protein
VVINKGRVIAHDTPDGLKRRVGGLTLRVRPADPSRVPDVLRLLDRVAAPGTAASHDTAAGARPGAVSVPVADDMALDIVVPALRQAGVEVNDLGLHLPSLDEVFHALTSDTEIPAKEAELV